MANTKNNWHTIYSHMADWITVKELEAITKLSYNSINYHIINMRDLKLIKSDSDVHRNGFKKKWIRLKEYLTQEDIYNLRQLNFVKNLKYREDGVRVPERDMPKLLPMGRIIQPENDPRLREKHLEASQMRRKERSKIRGKVHIGSTFEMMV